MSHRLSDVRESSSITDTPSHLHCFILGVEYNGNTNAADWQKKNQAIFP